MRHLIVGQVGIKIITSRTGGEESNQVQRTCLNQDGKTSSANKISLTNLKASNFAVNSKHAIEEQSQSQSCFESKVGEEFRLIALSFLIEQLRRGCCTCKAITNLNA